MRVVWNLTAKGEQFFFLIIVKVYFVLLFNHSIYYTYLIVYCSLSKFVFYRGFKLIAYILCVSIDRYLACLYELFVFMLLYF